VSRVSFPDVLSTLEVGSMRTILKPVLCALALVTLSAHAAAEGPAKAEVRLEFLHLEMSGVVRAEVAAVARAASAVPGVRTVEWFSEGTEAKIVREVGTAADETLIRAVTGAGADTAGTVPLAVASFTFEKKLHCGGCVATVNKTLQALPGVKSSSVNVEMTSVSVVYDTRKAKTADVEAALVSIQKPGKHVP
jgi:copper chaperone CopZ